MNTSWFVLCIRAGRDVAITKRLTDEGFNVYSPMGQKIVIHKRYKTKSKKEFVLFPGYLFINGHDSVAEAMGYYGVYGFLGADDEPTELPEGYVEGLQHEEASGTFDTSNGPAKGDTIELEIFGVKIQAKVVGTNARGKIKAVAEFMGRQIKIERDDNGLQVV